MKDNYFVGLDVGTSSVGWAVSDNDYNLLRLKGKTAWGSRIFSEAKDCKVRRSFRSNRRRIQRRKYRLKLLNELFAEEISKIDNTFFVRQANASYLFEDKEHLNISKNLLFKNSKEEKDFYKKFPTIWHLRKALIEGEEFALSDLRHVYFAIHHIMKYRGNFLNEGHFDYGKFNGEKLNELNGCLKKLISNEDETTENDFITSEKSREFESLLLDKKLTKTSKQKELKKLFNIYNCDIYVTMFCSIVTGGEFSLSKIDKANETKINFGKDYDENVLNIAKELGDAFDICKIAKEYYDFYILNDLLGDNDNLSYVMVDVYEEHKKDLELLKTICKDIDKNRVASGLDECVYYEMFKKEDKEYNYASLVNVNTSKAKRNDIEGFDKKVKALLLSEQEHISNEYEEEVNYIIDKCEKFSFLRIIANLSTGVIPHQLHLNELTIIIDNASKKYEFLRDIKDKLIVLFKHRVPYYYGPLDPNSIYSNVEKIKDEKITPWNISEIVDDNKTRAKFMRKLTNSCSYLYGESVMPKASLCFEEYLVLDRLNAMLVNGSPLINEEKEYVKNYLLSREKTTINQLKSHLSIKRGTKPNDILISNISDSIPFEAKSHANMLKMFNNFDREIIEYFIFLATVYADDKKFLKEVLKKDYSSLSDEQIKTISNLRTNKWAPLSYKLLTGIRYISDAGEALTILDVMRNTNNNFQKVLFDKQYNFRQIIDDYNKEQRGELNDEDIIKELLDSTTSMNKRSIHQTLLILNDIVKATGNHPSKIFVEVTRKNDEKKKDNQPNSREKEVSNFIKSLLKDANESYIDDAKHLNEVFETLEKVKLKSKHVYLYFKQMGLDMYTGLRMDLNDVIYGNKYDIDHIIPQSLIKDDSIDNMVLVNKDSNEKVKKGLYPIPYSIKTPEVIKLWKYLYKINAITDKKYNNLMRTTEISLEELEDFVARQINVVNQSNIVLRDILKVKYPNTEVVFSKAQYPSHVRKVLDIAKNRDVNDTHHAVDAYLNIFAGNVLSSTFTNVYRMYAKRQENPELSSFNMDGVLERKLKKEDNKGVIYGEKIRNNCFRHDHLVTYKLDMDRGPLYKQTIYKKGTGSLIPQHTNDDNPMKDTTKYGGYSSLASAYMVAVKYKEGKKEKKAILRVPLLYDLQYKDNQEELLKVVVNNPKATNIELIRKIYLNQKIKYKKGIYLIYTNNESQNKYKNVYQNYVDNDVINYINKANKNIKEFESNLDSYSITNRYEKTYYFSKSHNYELFIYFLSIVKNPIYDNCMFISKTRNLDIKEFKVKKFCDQIEILLNFITLLSRQSESCNLIKYFSNAPSTMCFRVSNNITDQDVTLIYESPTGLYSHEVKI